MLTHYSSRCYRYTDIIQNEHVSYVESLNPLVILERLGGQRAYSRI